jgi:hypothetical protein
MKRLMIVRLAIVMILKIEHKEIRAHTIQRTLNKALSRTPFYDVRRSQTENRMKESMKNKMIRAKTR